MNRAISCLGSLVFLLAFLGGVEVCAAEGSIGRAETEAGIDLLGVPQIPPPAEDRSDRFAVTEFPPHFDTKDDLLSLQVGCVRGERSDGSAVEGSGFVVAPEYFLTSGHGIRQTQRLRVRFQDGASNIVYPATLLSVSPVLDLALLHLPTWKAPPLFFSRSNGKKIGEKVSAVGCPLGGALAVSTGEITANDKTIGIDSLIRSRLAVQPGNSGGPLLDPAGTVVGMVLWTMKEGPENAFARPARELEYFLGESFFQMGVLLADVGRYADAAEIFTLGLRFTPESAKAYNNLGEVFRLMRKGKMSEGALQKSLAFDPDYAEAHYNLGLLYRNLLNHPTKAALHFRRYLYLHPTAPEAGQIGRWLTDLSAPSSNTGLWP